MTHDCCFCDAKFRSFPLLASHLYDQHKKIQAGDLTHSLSLYEIPRTSSVPSGFYCWCGYLLTKEHIKQEGGLVAHVLSIGFFQPELPF